MTIDEIRAMEGLNPVDDGGSARFMQLNMTTVDRIINPPAAAPADEFAPVTSETVDENDGPGAEDSVDDSEQAEMLEEIQ